MTPPPTSIPLSELLSELDRAVMHRQTLALSDALSSVDAWVVAHWYQQSSKRIVLITPTDADAETVATDLATLAPAIAPRIIYLPAWDALPYSGLSPHQDVMAAHSMRSHAC